MLLHFLRDQKVINPNFIEDNLTDLCASIQHSLVEILLHKIKKACSTYAFTQVAIAGGVSANSYLRHRLQEWGTLSNTKIFVPKFEYCTDNAAMIAITGKFLFMSTSELYSGNDNFNIDESQIGTTTPSHSRACYIESKRCGDVTSCQSS